MRISLSSSELQRLTDLVGVLHSPFDYPGVDDWRHAVNHHAQALLRAHKVVFMLPGAGHAPVYCQDLDPAGFRAYIDYYHQFDIAGSIALDRGMSVSSLLEIHGKDEFYGSEYYNDFMRVWDCNHSVGLVTPIDATPGYAYLGVLRDRRNDPPFGARTRELMRLLEPAFRAGVLTHLRLSGDRAVLGAVLDVSSMRLLVCDGKGRPVQISAALARTLEAEPDRSRIERAMKEIALVTASLASPEADACKALDHAGERSITTSRGSYRLIASLAGETGPRPAGVLVLLEPGFREPKSDSELRERYGLTPQEIRVARLIAVGLQNHALAHRLEISPHTARRHTEHVLEKLAVASRAQVEERISHD